MGVCHYFNAGKADACVISNGNNNVMIDTGENTLSKEILSYFDKHNITTLDYLIITHFDKDHVGSASSIIDNIKVDSVLQSNVPKDSEFYENYLKELSENNLNIYTCLICPVCRYNTLKYVSIPAVLCLTQNKLSCV